MLDILKDPLKPLGGPWGSLRLLVLLSCLVGGVGCPHRPIGLPTGMIPDCPGVTMEMVDELWLGGLDDSPAIEQYLGRVEGYCDAVSEVNGGY